MEESKNKSKKHLGECKDCLYYQAKSGTHGHCRRYPPRVTFVTKQITHKPTYEECGVIAMTEWPVVEENDACGEFKLGKEMRAGVF